MFEATIHHVNVIRPNNATIDNFDDLVVDINALPYFDLVTGTFTAPIPGYYKFTFQVNQLNYF